MAVGLKEISERLNVSRSTVSRVLNNKQILDSRGVPYISAKTVARVLAVSKELGYRPNQVARSLVLGKTKRIAFWIPDMTLRVFQGVGCKFHNYLRNVGYEMFLCEFSSDMLSQSSSMGLARADVDGTFLYGGALGDDLEWEKQVSDLAIVNMGVVPYKGTFDYVRINVYPAVVEAMEHLLKTKRNRIVHALCDCEKNDADPRYRGYINTLKKAGKTPEFLVIDPDMSRKESAHRDVCEYLKANECPDAFFCAEDEIAIGVYKGIRDLGFKIPEDVAIIGFDGIPETKFFDSPISTIFQPLDEICTQAWELLSKRMKNTNTPRQERVLKAKFLSRESSHGSN